MLCWISLTKFQRWEIAPESGTRKGGRANGSRTYQLMMKKLQLLPYIPKEIQKPPQPFKGKGKRRAATPPNDDQGSSLLSTPTKKPQRQQVNIINNVRNDPDDALTVSLPTGTQTKPNNPGMPALPKSRPTDNEMCDRVSTPTRRGVCRWWRQRRRLV